MLDRLFQAYQRRTDRKLWRRVCAELGLAYAEPVASGTVDGLRVELDLEARRARITTGLPATFGFSRRDDTVAATVGDVWVDGNAVLRGEVAVWLRALDRDTRKSLDQLVRLSAATLVDGTLELRESPAAMVKPTVADRVTPIRTAIAVATRLVAAAADTDDNVLFEACKRGSLRERLVALTLVGTRYASDPRTKALLADIEADREPDAQMLAAVFAARWPKVALLADDARCATPVLAEAVAMLRAIYPRLASLPDVAALPTQAARDQLVAALKVMCAALATTGTRSDVHTVSGE